MNRACLLLRHEINQPPPPRATAMLWRIMIMLPPHHRRRHRMCNLIIQDLAAAMPRHCPTLLIMPIVVFEARGPAAAGRPAVSMPCPSNHA